MSKSTHISTSIRNPVNTTFPKKSFQKDKDRMTASICIHIISFQRHVEIEFTLRRQNRLQSIEYENRLWFRFSKTFSLWCARSSNNPVFVKIISNDTAVLGGGKKWVFYWLWCWMLLQAEWHLAHAM